MDLDLPLILTSAVLISGAIWAFDVWLLKPRRVEAASGAQADETLESELEAREGVQEARDGVLKEPVLVEYARSFFPVLVLVLVLRSFLMEPYQIPSGSMIPTLLVGDFILVNKFSYGIRLPVLGSKVVDVGDPKRGDVMVFIPPHESRYFIKRVVGLPGDLIEYDGVDLRINGEVVPSRFVAQLPPAKPTHRLYEEQLGEVEHLVQRDLRRRAGYVIRPRTSAKCRVSQGAWRVPEDHYFMMGDNRDVSDDSRSWGCVPDANVVGKAVAIWIHKDPGWHWPSFGRNHLIQ